MKEVSLKRSSDDGRETLGTLSFIKDNGQLFVCKTLELPWKNNQSNVSCIPTGTYTCKFTKSARFSARAGHDVFTYEVLNVPGRGGIRIHSANRFPELLGCIAPGDAFSNIDSDNEPDVINSRNTVAALVNELQKQDFTLVVSGIIPL